MLLDQQYLLFEPFWSPQLQLTHPLYSSADFFSELIMIFTGSTVAGLEIGLGADSIIYLFLPDTSNNKFQFVDMFTN